MPTSTEHAFKERSTKFLILLPLRIIQNGHFNVRHPVIMPSKSAFL